MSFKQLRPKLYPIKSEEDLSRSKESGVCRVCGDQAYIANYGALSCQSCKVFFRRNGFHPQNLHICSFDGCCDINKNTRRTCTACRLAKCFSVGMSSDRIRKEVQRGNKCLSSDNANRNQQIMGSTRLTASSLFDNDQSSLTNSEWRLLSNVIHAHDTFSTVLQIRRTIENISTSSLDMSYALSSLYQIIALVYTSMESFISSAPDFRILTMNEQYSLFERNLHGVVALYSNLIIRPTGLFENLKCIKVIESVYGSELISQAERIDKRLDCDLIIMKLILIILAFSSNCFILHTRDDKIHRDGLLNGTFRLFGSQNIYTELLWKYMIYRYGYYNAALRFCRVITIFLDIMKYSATIYTTNETHQHLVEDVFEQSVESLVIHQDDQSLLWGRT